MSVLQECLDKFSKKLSIILEAQGVSPSVLVYLDSYHCAVCGGVVRQGCRSTLLNALLLTFSSCLCSVIDLSLPVSLSGSDWDHTEVSEVEAAELCQRVSELLCLLHLIFVSHSATFLRLSHSAASLPSVSTPHGENITGFWCFILALFWLCPSVCSQ